MHVIADGSKWPQRLEELIESADVARKAGLGIGAEWRTLHELRHLCHRHRESACKKIEDRQLCGGHARRPEMHSERRNSDGVTRVTLRKLLAKADGV